MATRLANLTPAESARLGGFCDRERDLTGNLTDAPPSPSSMLLTSKWISKRSGGWGRAGFWVSLPPPGQSIFCRVRDIAADGPQWLSEAPWRGARYLLTTRFELLSVWPPPLEPAAAAFLQGGKEEWFRYSGKPRTKSRRLSCTDEGTQRWRTTGASPTSGGTGVKPHLLTSPELRGKRKGNHPARSV